MLQTHICKQCGYSFTGGPRAYYCLNCRTKRQRESNRDYKARKKTGELRKHGSIDTCECCGKEYIVNASLQRFCPDCQKPHMLEYDRISGLEYYHNNKDNINPSRYDKRRIGPRKCAWCGKEFETNNKSLTCSPECGKQRKNALWREYYKKRKENKNV